MAKKPKKTPKPKGPKPDWKLFEEFIARIEQVLFPSGAIVKRSDRIRDMETGKLRQVDASIRYKLGAVDGLITIECRKRKQKSDVTWIEQLVTKRMKIGADRTIAVSTKRLSGPAIQTATKHFIEVRILSQITEQQILTWLPREIYQATLSTQLRDALVFLYPHGEGPLDHCPKENIPGGMNFLSGELYIFPDRRSSALTIVKSLSPVFRKLEMQRPATKEQPTRTEGNLRFPRGAAKFLTKEGERDLALVYLKVDIALNDIVFIPVGPPSQYSSPDGPLVTVAESRTEFLGAEVVVTFLKDENSGQVTTSVHVNTK